MPTKHSDDVFHDLHRLIKKGDLIGLRAWIAAEGDVNLRNRFGWSLLMLTALHGRADMVELLLAAGADAETKNNFGDTAVGLARLKGFNRTAHAIEHAMV